MPHATLRELKLESQYRTNPLDRGSVVRGFYIPVLETAVKYDRISGFFSSSSFALAARGIAALIANGGHMRLICSPHLSPGDVDILRKFADKDCSTADYEAHLDRVFRPSESQIEKDHLAALGWMLANGHLEIMLAVVCEPDGTVLSDALFHPKVGLVTDAVGNEISFSGSNNETVSGWADNQEEFKVFKAWEEGQYAYYQNDRDDFEQYWRDNVKGVRCFDLPIAFKKRLVQVSQDFNRESFLAKYYVREKRRNEVWAKLSLRDYQQSAIDEWIKNDYSLLFEMATGSGKTRTAIGCANKVMEREKRGCIVVAAPRIALCAQWREEMEGCLCEPVTMIVANSDNNQWRTQLKKSLAYMSRGVSPTKWIVVFASHLTAASTDFLEILGGCELNARMLIADETHALGAPDLKKALMEFYRYRVGLSATPERMFDEAGSRLIQAYFGNHGYMFTLGDAIARQRVCSYRYYPLIVPLSAEEREAYDQLSEKITKLARILDHEYDPDVKKRLDRALMDRADIVTAARGKIPLLQQLLRSGGKCFDKNVIAFTCHQNIEEVIRVFSGEMKTTRRFSHLESDPSVRQEILKQFASGGCAALVAMKCLDEGIDIPTAETALLISSTTNPREYIQRIGRVLRTAEGKRFARIYDFIVSLDDAGVEILDRDLKRALCIAEYAENASEAFNVLYRKKGVKQ